MKDGIRTETRQLPFMLGKLVGGILAVIGFGGLVYISTRPPKPAALSILLYAAAGAAGIALFIVSSRIMSSRSGKDAGDGPARRTTASKALPWVILLVLALLFIVIVLVM